jgi:hypothetical protein
LHKIDLENKFVQFDDFFALKINKAYFRNIFAYFGRPLPSPCHPTENPFGEYPLTPCKKEKDKQKITLSTSLKK